MHREQQILAYHKALYEIASLNLVLRIGCPHPDWDDYLDRTGHLHYAIITPYNPHSNSLTIKQNNERMDQFSEYLKKNSIHPVLIGANKDPDHEWPEETTCILLDESLSCCFDLACTFDQSAFVFGQRGLVPFLVWTEDPLRSD